MLAINGWYFGALDRVKNYCVWDLFGIQSKQQLLQIMLKPKTQNFKVKVMLYKLEAVSNKVMSRCHASIKIDGEEMYFPTTPELKKNVALFNSEVQTDNFSIYLDEITGLYENKEAVLTLQIETQGTKMKMGEVVINLGGILNEKKYKIVNSFALLKCYDKTAKVRVSVDFIPISRPEAITVGQRREKKQTNIRQMISNNPSQRPGLNANPIQQGNWKQPNYKSRLVQESNYILQQKIYEYEQKMDNYRLSQTQLQQRLHEQISNKDEQINEITIELNRKSQQLAAANVQIEKYRFKIRDQNEEVLKLKEQIQGLLTMIQNLQREEENLRKENGTIKSSLQIQGKTKQNKQKYYVQELAKYTSRYLQSEQQRNKIIFELQTKFKEQMQKKQNNYRSLIAANQNKANETIANFKHRISQFEKQLDLKEQKIQKIQAELKKMTEFAQQRSRQLNKASQQNEEIKAQNSQLKRDNSQLTHELQTLNFSYNEMDRELQKITEQRNLVKKNNQQLKMELQMANQTIQEQRKQLSKYSKQLQVNRERQYFLTEKYNEQLQIKSYHESNIKGESLYLRNQISKLRNQLTLSEERVEEQISKGSELKDKIHRLEIEVNNRGQSSVRLTEEKINLQNQLKLIREELSQMEQAVMILKEENMSLLDSLKDKRVVIENDRSIQWSIKIEQLQNDIAEMVQKFKSEKQIMRETFKKQETKKKEQLSQLQLMIRKLKEQNQEIKRNIMKKQQIIKDLDKNLNENQNQLRLKEQIYEEAKQKIRVLTQNLDQTQNKYKSYQQSIVQKIKENDLKISKQATIVKKLQQTKSSYQRIVQQLLDYLTKPYQTYVTYQEIVGVQVEADFVNVLNLSIRKHCEQRSKVRQVIKKLQMNNRVDAIEFRDTRKNDLEALRIDKKNIIEQNNYTRYTINQVDDHSWRNHERSNAQLQIQEFRNQNSRLKRQISQLKVKLKSTQEQVGKAERNADVQRANSNDYKRQLQETQDQIDKLNFQNKRKQKRIIQMQNQLKELLTELAIYKNNQIMNSSTSSKPMSRTEIKQKEKEEAIMNNRKDIIIRDLESKLDNKKKQNEEMQQQINRLKTQCSTLKENYVLLLNENKLNQTKFKDRCGKYALLESQFQQTKAKLQQNIQLEAMRHKKDLQALAQQIIKAQEDSSFLQKTNELINKENQQLSLKLKKQAEQNRQNQGKLKKQNQNVIVGYKQKLNELQTAILMLKSQIQQSNFNRQQQALKIANLNSILNKKNAEIQSLLANIKTKDLKLSEFQENIELIKANYDSKIGQLRYLIEELEDDRLKKQYEFQELRFTSQGKILDLQKRLQEHQKANA